MMEEGDPPQTLLEELDAAKKKMTKYAALAKQKIKIIEERDAAIAALTENIDCLQKKLDETSKPELECENESLKAKIEELTQEVSAGTARTIKRDEKLERQNAIMEEQRKEIDTLSAAVHSLQEQNERLAQELVASQSSANSNKAALENALSELEQSNSKHAVEIALFQGEFSLKLQAVDELTEELRLKTLECAGLSNDLQDNKGALERLRTECGQYDRLLVVEQSLTGELKAKLETINDECAKKDLSMQNLQCQVCACNETISVLEETKLGLQAAMLQSTNALEESNKVNDNLKALIPQLQQELQKALDEIALSEKQAASLSQVMNDEINESNDAHQMTLCAYKQELSSLSGILHSRVNGNERIDSEHHTSIEANNGHSTVQELQEQLAALSDSNARALREVQRLQQCQKEYHQSIGLGQCPASVSNPDTSGGTGTPRTPIRDSTTPPVKYHSIGNETLNSPRVDVGDDDKGMKHLEHLVAELKAEISIKDKSISFHQQREAALSEKLQELESIFSAENQHQQEIHEMAQQQWLQELDSCRAKQLAAELNIADLHASVASTENIRVDLETEVLRLTGLNTNLKEQVAQLTAEASTAKEARAQQLQVAAAKVADIERTCEQQIRDLQGRESCAQEQLSHLTRQFEDASVEVQNLQSQLGALTLSVETANAENAQLHSIISCQRTRLEELESNSAVPMQSENDKLKIEAAETANKKLMMKVKILMKEIAEHKSQLEHLNNALSVSQVAHEDVERLNQELHQAEARMHEYQRQLSVEQSDKSALQGKLDEANQLIEELNASLSACQSVDEDVLRLNQQLQDAQAHVLDFQRELSQNQVDMSSLHEQLNESRQRLQASEDAKTKLEAELDEQATKLNEQQGRESNSVMVKHLEKELDSLRDLVALKDREIAETSCEMEKMRTECAQTKANNEALMIAMDMRTDSQTEIQQLNEQLETLQQSLSRAQSERDVLLNEKNDISARADALTEKAKRMKMLLAKSKEQIDQLKLEQQQQQQQQQQNQQPTLPPSFEVLARVDVNSGEEESRWCCIRAQCESPTASSSVWVLESTILESNGGTTATTMPVSLTQQLSELSLHLQSQQRALAESQRSLTSTRNELEDVRSAFSEYKLRAQSALKRFGSDERAQKQQLHASETAVTERLNQQVLQMGQQLAAHEEAAQQMQYMLRVRETAVEEANEIISVLRAELVEKENEIQRYQTQLVQPKDSKAMPSDRLNVTCATEDVITSALFQKDHVEQQQNDKSINSESESHVLVTEQVDKEAPFEEINVVAASAESKQHAAAKMVVHRQVNEDIREIIEELRTENAKLMVELVDSRTLLGLNAEQMAALKETISQLGSELAVEKEFNASHRRINAEYLMNVIRQFLMSDSDSERAQLVRPICSLLHLRSDDAKTIADKWAVSKSGGYRNNGGLLGFGWLPINRPDANSNSSARVTGNANVNASSGGKNSSGSFDPFVDGLGSLHAYS